MEPVRRNVVAGLLLIALGLLFGSFMAAARDFAWVEAWFRRPPIRSNQVMYAHAHLGVIGLVNLALAFVLPHAALTPRRRFLLSWAAVIAGLLVPAGMMFALLPEPWDSLVYAQAGGFLLLLCVAAGTAWAMRRPS